ncbi:hypothetical protein [Umezawaea sp. Da 62-37]|uniref:hypothetical protein n=1 Tax=Umezawaea sp. Da 62-37 TaxID=3075927 RepID=UPI0028F7446C|nr:hypothetical protein [Umezawaea sp. Da 62-37]WNV84725.1 hypothetical protein RM788_42275 [Umezawaea sp. Da 62-37]
MDHPDQWYRGGELVAIVHYPYGMAWDELRDATAGCAALGLRLDIDSQWAVHACHQWILAVVISAVGLHEVVHGPRTIEIPVTR